MKITPVNVNNQNFGIKFPILKKQEKIQQSNNNATIPISEQDLRNLLQTQEQTKIRRN